LTAGSPTIEALEFLGRHLRTDNVVLPAESVST